MNDAGATALSGIDYDAIADLYDHYVASDVDVAFFLDEVAAAGGDVLELTSGTGRLSIPLLEAGASLTCVDASAGMLAVLTRKLGERGLRAQVHCMDVRRLSLPGRYRLAILPFHSFMEFTAEDDQRAVLRSVRDCLEQRGRFICTLHNPAIRRAAIDGTHRLVGCFPMRDGWLVVSGFERGGRPVVSRVQFFEHYGPDGVIRWKRFLPMEFSLVERDAFERLATGAGFRVVDLHGNYDRSPFDPEHSPFMIWVLEREG